MGSSSRSNSNQSTSNASTTFGIQGANNGLVLNGSGNTVTDGGAFSIVNDLVRYLLPDLASGANKAASDALYAATDLAQAGVNQNQDFLRAGVDLFGETSNAQQEMMRLGANVLTDTGDILTRQQQESFDFARNVTDQSINAVSDTADTAITANRQVTQDAIEGNKDLAVIVADSLQTANDNNTMLAKYSMDNSAVLAENLSQTALDSVNEANNDAFKQLASGFESMMGFAEQYSRSDGADLAAQNNRTMLLALGGVSLTALAVAYIMRSK
ncbi:hypothetical protein [Shewanella dokdonensis]|uniref:Uncharacterized protein n=1 Tax=Shewanella dokdonensis TaxID=712036 RepID=A0ABX8DH16_9GAMM|nr:hypothetical protein [Shewanella dokdonensis]MCL1072993.1 hypothetical protein [Shewanella dokdonensis]QVK23092.1 hypothetical protein KHX94_18670 [Shewanella dokdonensis]